jgi:hypothetical protein
MKIFTFLIFTLWSTGILLAQPQISLTAHSSGFSNPIDIVHAGDDRLFIVQQRGLIRMIDENGDIISNPFLDLRSKVNQTGNERGLLGLAFHPEYNENGYFFVNYTRDPDGTTVVSRFSVDSENPNVADTLSEKQIITIEQPYDNHNAGNLLFGPDGYLYIAVGDGGSGGDPQNYSQNHMSLLGKMLRIDIDVEDEIPYAIPDDNPFAADDFTRDEIWALGLRNHWRNSFDRLTGDLWIADVGQSAREEINFQPASSTGGENYGWRCYEGNIPYNTSGCGDMEFYTFPVFEYGHQGSGCSGSVTGGFVYRGALYNALYGYFIAADYCTGNFYWVKQNGESFESGILGTFSPFQYSSFGEDSYGELYVSLRGAGQVQIISETSDCKPVAHILETGPLELIPDSSVTLTALYHPTLQYQWYRGVELLTGETDHKLHAVLHGEYSVVVTNPENSCVNTSETVEVLVQEPTIINTENIDNIIIYPNPASDFIHISGLSAQSPQSISIVLRNVLGKEVFSSQIKPDVSYEIAISSLANGIYFLSIEILNQRMIKKVVIQR